jgi:hypothetical protein
MKDLLPTVPGDDAVVDAASEIKGTVQSPQVLKLIRFYSDYQFTALNLLL